MKTPHAILVFYFVLRYTALACKKEIKKMPDFSVQFASLFPQQLQMTLTRWKTRSKLYTAEIPSSQVNIS